MGERGKRQFLQHITGSLELPEDVILDLPKLTVTGNVQLLVENHKGIIEYTPEKIRVRTRVGEIIINGTDLRIDSLFREEILMQGRIAGVQFADKGD